MPLPPPPSPICSPSVAAAAPLRRPRRWPPLPRTAVAVAAAAAVTAAATAAVLAGLTPVPTAAAAAAAAATTTTKPTSGALTTSGPFPPLPTPPHPSSDGDCDAAVTASAATGSLPAAVRALVTESTYFSIFKVNLERPCPYWPDDSMCAVRDCSVCACEPDEVPPLWRAADALRASSRAAGLPPGADGGTTNADGAAVLVTAAGGGVAASRAAADFPGGVSSAPAAALVGADAVAAEPAAAVACDAGGRGDALNDVDRRVAAGADAGGWEAGGAAAADAWTEVEDDADMTYVDLRANVERFTGYAGASAARVWRVIYEENCFRYGRRAAGGEGSSPAGGLNGLGLGSPAGGAAASAAAPPADSSSGPDGGGGDAAAPSSTMVAGAAAAAASECKEERVFFRLLSGIHTSINMHIAAEYLFPSGWGPNLALYKARVAAYPDRVSNLYFTLAVVLRAVAKAAPSLAPGVTHYTTGNATSDALTATLVSNVLGAHPLLAPGCAMRTFNESDMFLGGPAGGGAAALAAAAEAGGVPATLAASSSAEARTEFRDAFRNVSTIMDCVGCEKCRLWGKLQFLGLGTALRILFSPNGGEAAGLALQRNEIIALFNLLNKLLLSVEAMTRMDGQLAADAAAAATAAWRRAAAGWMGGAALTAAAVAVALRQRQAPAAAVPPVEGEARGGGVNTPTVLPQEGCVADGADGDQPGEGATKPVVVRSRAATATAAAGGGVRRRRGDK